MPALPLAHVSWAIADNADRPGCDAFFLDVFGAETAYEMLVTPETEHYGFDREERLMMIGDTMIIPIAPAGGGLKETSGIGKMLRRSAAPHRWLGVSLRVADLKAAAAWFSARGFELQWDRGMENNYFLVPRWQVLGMRVEIMFGELPGDPRVAPGGMAPLRQRAAAHPLGIEGLIAIGLSAPDVASARALFGERLELPEVGFGEDRFENADVVAFHLGDTVIEALAPRDPDSPLAAHLREVQGIRSLTFKVRDLAAAAQWLRGKGLNLIGDSAERLAVDPAQAQGRLIWLSETVPAGYPPLGSRMTQPAEFPVTA